MQLPVCPTRRALLALYLGSAVWPAWANGLYPNRTIRLVCPTAPGSSPDTLARLMARQMALQLGQMVVVENMPGAGTTRATAFVAAAVPDGYTLLLTFSPTFSLSVLRYKSANYRPRESFTPLGSFASITPFLVVNSSVPARTLGDYVALAKQTPQRLEFATAGAASIPLLLGETFAQAAGIDLLFVPYASEAESRQDVISGRVASAVFWAPATLQLLRAGKIRPLAYAGNIRHPDFPDVPTFTEQGFPSVVFHLQMLLLAPAGLAPDITLKLSESVGTAMRSTEIRSQFKAIGIEPTWGGTAQTAALIADDSSRFAQQGVRRGGQSN